MLDNSIFHQATLRIPSRGIHTITADGSRPAKRSREDEGLKELFKELVGFINIGDFDNIRRIVEENHFMPNDFIDHATILHWAAASPSEALENIMRYLLEKMRRSPILSMDRSGEYTAVDMAMMRGNVGALKAFL